MNIRTLGNTDLQVSALGFGCGAVGGLMVRGEYRDMVRAVGRAVDAGITYFDTAQLYGDGVSETNLGKVLHELGVDAVVGTKLRLLPNELADIPAAVRKAAEVSLRRLRRETLDLFQLHNPLAGTRQAQQGWVTPEDAAIAAETFVDLQEEGKIRWWGLNGIGETAAVHQAVDRTADGPGLHSLQVCYNLLNPSAGRPMAKGFAFQNYDQLIDRVVDHGAGVIAIRVLAAGALSGSAERQPIAAQNVAPIATNSSFAADVAQARTYQFLVDDGYAGSLVEAAIRFAASDPNVATALVGLSNQEQLEQAIAAVERGPLPDEAMERLEDRWQG